MGLGGMERVCPGVSQVCSGVPRCVPGVPRCAQVCSGVPRCVPGVSQVCSGVPRCVPGVPRCAQVCPGVARGDGDELCAFLGFDCQKAPQGLGCPSVPPQMTQICLKSPQITPNPQNDQKCPKMCQNLADFRGVHLGVRLPEGPAGSELSLCPTQ
ncbi:hypothetical protein DV515_00019940 [Chloebia gouldiae]|uniref:Uncharacterized protein n=1 Tax=Chloebia gouldiae TaxID=44316 RepID=A0A3L8Q342_CHLGU|nr:hypothetical protein DV515_00019940 [Chloebia gouldiae]